MTLSDTVSVHKAATRQLRHQKTLVKSHTRKGKTIIKIKILTYSSR